MGRRCAFLRAAASLVCLHVGARTVVQGTDTRRDECASQVGHALCGCKDDGNSFTMTCYDNGTITGDQAPARVARSIHLLLAHMLLPAIQSLFHGRTPAPGLAVAIWTGVTFASIGTPTGVCGAFHPGGCCGDPAKAAAYVAKQCVGKSSCMLNADINTFNGGADPCQGIAKHVNVQLVCSIAAPPAPPPAGPPVPTWTPNWNLTESTVIQPGGCDLTSPACKNGQERFEINHTWGLVSLDWSVGDSTWTAHSTPTQNNQTATSKAICKTLKQSGKAQRCFICEHLRSIECRGCSFLSRLACVPSRLRQTYCKLLSKV